MATTFLSQYSVRIFVSNFISGVATTLLNEYWLWSLLAVTTFIFNVATTFINERYVLISAY